MNNKICCFFGHRKIENEEETEALLYNLAQSLIREEKVSEFLFGSRSRFDDICYKVISDMKKYYPHIRRVYVRAEYPDISEEYRAFLLEGFEDTYFPEKAVGAGRAVYVKRNYEMIDRSDFCVVYYNEDYKPSARKKSKSDLFQYNPKSGTKIAYDYAKKKGKKIINVVSKIS